MPIKIVLTGTFTGSRILLSSVQKPELLPTV